MFKKRSQSSGSKRRRQVDITDVDMKEKVVISGKMETKKKMNQFSTSNGKRVSVQDSHIESERTIVPQAYAGDAFHETLVDTEKDRDARAILEKNIALNAENGNMNENEEKVYTGKAGYKNYITKKESQVGANKYTGTQGPIRAQTWARSICRMDYNPSLCKDYNETGFCGYGDSCIYLHDRGDYKSGWKIDQEWNEKQKEKEKKLQERGGTGGDVSEDDDTYLIKSDDEEQFGCTICKDPFHNAIVTECGHFFCEACALRRYQKTAKCFNCLKQLNGVFNPAESLRTREKREMELAGSCSDEEEEKEPEIKVSGSWSVVS